MRGFAVQYLLFIIIYYSAPLLSCFIMKNGVRHQMRFEYILLIFGCKCSFAI